MKTSNYVSLGCILMFTVAPLRAGVVSSTVHGVDAHDLDAMIATDDLIAGQLGTELAPLYGWHGANGMLADQLPAFTDGAGLLASGLTGLLNDFPASGTPAKTVRYSFAAADIASLRVLSGNQGGDGRVFSTTVIRYSNNEGGSFNSLGYFQSDPSGTINSGQWRSTLVTIFDDSNATLLSGVTDIIFELYAVDNTGGEMRDPFDGVNPFTGADDGLTAPIASPLVWELDVIAVPEPSALVLLGLGLLTLWRGPVGRRRKNLLR